MSLWDDTKNELKRDEFRERHGYYYSSQTFAFSRKDAVYYAHTYWSHPNVNYPYDPDNDCTNFVSQCWTYAGIPVSVDWFCDHITGEHFVRTNSWVGAEEFANYMMSRGYCQISYTSLDANLGDVVQFYNPEHGWHHSAIITKKEENGNLAYCAHSDSNNDKDLTAYYRKSGEQLRFLCPYNAY
ncbi:Hypothetical protein LUCI_3431 [Lucifera butyrica]|uniref:Putative amidase domain-containing protein n=1 Tax=Lucifera butyrica TaxID=1351585 RepID=A0A498R611_9FIRM|nr:amidase domain-containing protein [Lucifera butyrica]VBB08166.1 Hypothetical protein LUCI_3431 [Lucifera butyrica]